SDSTEQPLTSLSFKGLSVSVLIDDKPVEMYKPEFEGNKATCYIESIEGKEFKTQGQMLNNFAPYVMTLWTYVDGTDMGGAMSSNTWSPAVFTGPLTTLTTIQPLVFSKINLTDDAEIASGDEQFVKHLGTVQIRCVRAMDRGGSGPGQPTIGAAGFSNDRAVDERSKKANISHQVGLGQAKVVPAAGTANLRYVDQKSQPYATFEIKYRSRALLEVHDFVKPRIAIEDDAPVPSTSAAAQTNNNAKKRKPASEYKIDKDGAIVISDDSDDDDDEVEVQVKKEGNKKVKKEKNPEVKKEKEWLVID
ncbi:uncharacterized protein JCM6883_007073, partial [Sporobolomyces salmoneus]|uniref:uncharacterized protein n=1 Tax=Sporobolomyces salmoneus TaxID=183962 RepID=UPI0031705F69